MENGEQERSAEQVICDEWNRVVKPLIPEIDREVTEYFLDQTLAAYSEEGRYYHTLEHIADCVQKLAPYRGREDYLQLFLALLWHDVVYDTRSQTNEEDSAAVAREVMEVLELPGVDAVSRLIVATKTHEAEQEDEALIVAIDLSILGSDSERYGLYAEGIYKEYSWVEPSLFRAKRAEILEGFFAPFSHPDFMHLNEPAKRNIDNEVLELKAA